MKKNMMRLAGILSVSVIAAMMAGCGNKGEQSATESAIADGVVRVGIVNGQDEFAAYDGQKFTGIEPEILEQAAAGLGVTLEYQEVSGAEELLKLLDEGIIEVAAGRLTDDELYADSHIFSRNYAGSGLYLVTKEGYYTDNFAGFHDVSVGVSSLIPASDIRQIAHLSDLQQTAYSDMKQAASDLKSDVVKALLCTEREALSLLEDGGVQALELYQGPKLETVFYMSAGQTDLEAGIDQAINGYLDQKAQEE